MALALRKAIEAASETADKCQQQQLDADRRRAIFAHAAASRDCVVWAQNAGCFAPYERGLARLLERYASALRAVPPPLNKSVQLATHLTVSL